MKLNHINLPVSDVAAAAIFFEAYFDFKCSDVKGDNVIAVLKGKDGFILVLMSSAFNKNGNGTYPDAFHIGFMFDEREQVNETWQKLHDGGVALKQEPAKIRDSFGFYFHFDGILIEVGTKMKD